MITLHQLRCFVSTFEHGSFTAAAAELGLAQPSISEQVRLLEQGLNAPLFVRVGRGLVPTEAAQALRPHAERVLTAVTEAGQAVASVRNVLEGTIRFGVFGTARHYLGSALVADVLREHPGVRLELIGQHSTEVLTDLRHGRLEAAVIALPIADEGLQVQPLMRDEVVYVSADPQRVRKPVTAAELAAAPLVLSEASWGNEDSTRRMVARAVQSVGGTLRPRIEVEDIETALEVAALGLADTITARGLLYGLGDRLSPGLHWASLRPRIYDEFAVVFRHGATLSPASRMVVTLAAARMRAIGAAAAGR